MTELEQTITDQGYCTPEQFEQLHGFAWNGRSEFTWFKPYTKGYKIKPHKETKPVEPARPRGAPIDPTSESQRKPWLAIPCSIQTWYRWKAEGIIMGLEDLGLPVTEENVMIYRDALRIQAILGGPFGSRVRAILTSTRGRGLTLP